METPTKRINTNIFEASLAFLILFAIIFSIINYFEIDSTESRVGNPFADYYSNPGINRITIMKFFAYSTYFILFIFLCFSKFKGKIILLLAYLASALAIAVLQWYELYYGSTFYYGEVRDKQGLGFPILSSYMITLIIWKLNYSKNKDRDLTIKLILTGIINLSLYQFYGLVYEPWKLWQS